MDEDSTRKANQYNSKNSNSKYKEDNPQAPDKSDSKSISKRIKSKVSDKNRQKGSQSQIQNRVGKKHRDTNLPHNKYK